MSMRDNFCILDNMKKLKDFKLTEQDTRLVLFGSTVFKIKCKTSVELQVAVRNESIRERIVQRDLKRATVAILSQVIMKSFLPRVYTGNITIYTYDSEWISCEKLYFAHYDQPLTAHPQVILMFASLPPPPPSSPVSNTLLGKHYREEESEDQDIQVKKIREDNDLSFVPGPNEADLPMEEGREVPHPDLVRSVAEETKRRLHSLTLPSSSVGTVLELEEDENTDRDPGSDGNSRSFFQYIKSFFGYS